MNTVDAVVWTERAIAWKDEAPAIEGPLETVVTAIGRLPSLSWMSFSITLPDRADPSVRYDGGLTRALIVKLRETRRT